MVLFVCETKAQLLNAINIKIHQLSNEIADICICNNNSEALHIYKNLKNADIFSQVYIYDAVLNTDQSIITKLKKGIYNINLIQRLKSILPNASAIYERIFISGPSLSSISVFYYFKSINKNTRLSLFEEGLYEYYMFSYRDRIKEMYSKLFFGNYYQADVDDIYIYAPQLVINLPKQVKPRKIFPLSLLTKEQISNINDIFGYKDKEDVSLLSYKYLFLEQAFPSKYENNLQKKVIKRIVNLVGNENIVIKLHPASPENKYKNEGIKAIKTHAAMEMLILNAKDFATQTVISISSSAIFNFKLSFGYEPNVILLYKIFGKRKLSDGIEKFIREFCKNYPPEKLFIPYDIRTMDVYEWEHKNEQ